MASSMEKLSSALPDSDDLSSLRRELLSIRDEIEQRLGKAASRGGRRLRSIGGNAGDMVMDVGRDLESRTAATVRARPAEALMLALGVGFLLAWLWRR